MSWIGTLVRWLTGDTAPPAEGPVSRPEQNATEKNTERNTEKNMTVEHSPEPAVSGALSPPKNDAERYGVTVRQVAVSPGATCWRAVQVHHLSPEENRGRHHLFVDALTSDGQRAHRSQARITWEDGEQAVTIDGPADEPGAGFPMWKQQVYAVEMLGLPSDRVENLQTDHPDEPNPDGTPSGNTRFRHSFLVEFRQVTDSWLPRRSIVEGTVQGGGGLTLRLVHDGETIAEGTLGASGTFRLRNLEPGTYFVQVLRPGEMEPVAIAGPLQMDGANRRQVELTVAAAEVEERPRPGGLGHYVLFGPAERSDTQALLVLLAGHLAARRLTFGFRAGEAAQAREVTIIGDTDTVPATVEMELAQKGVRVRRIRGTPEEILAALAA